MSVDERDHVGLQRVFGEADLADAGVDDARLFDAELDGAALGVLDRLADVRRHGADARVRHQAAGAQHLTETADEGHHVRGGDDAVEVDETALDALDEVFGADDLGAGRLGFIGLGVLGDDGDADVTAGARRQGDDAADLLVGVARVDAEVHGDLDAFVELGLGVGLHELDGFVDGVRRGAVAGPGLDAFRLLGHVIKPPPLSGPSRGRNLR